MDPASVGKADLEERRWLRSPSRLEARHKIVFHTIAATDRYSGYIVSFIVPAILVYYFNVNLFYDRGAWAWDAGWFASLIGHPSLSLPNSPVIDTYKYGSWYGDHISPFLAIVSWVGAVLPFKGPVLLALLLGTFEGVLGLTIFAALKVLSGSNPALRAAAAPLAVLASFGGPELATISFPHFEGGIAILALAFVTFRALGYRSIALAAFVCCLLLREDAGLHLALLLAAIAAANALAARSLRGVRNDALIMLAAVGYAVLAAAAQRIFTHGGGLFHAEFSGEPPYAHLTYRHLADQMNFLFENRRYLYWPILVTLLGAAWTRSWILLAGFASAVPWLLACVSAKSYQLAEMTGYYCFPLIIGSCWPAVAPLLDRDRGALPPARAFIIQLAVTVVSVAGFPGSRHLHIEKPWALFRPLPHDISIARTDAVIEWIGSAKPQLGNIVAGDGVVALDTDLFTSAEWYKWNDEWSPERFASTDTLVFFRGERLSGILENFIARNCGVTILDAPKTNIVIATRRDPAGILRRGGNLLTVSPAALRSRREACAPAELRPAG